MEMSTFKEWLNSIIEYAAQSPWEFVGYIFLALSPFFLASTYLSWKLMKHIESEEKRKNKKSKKKANIAEVRRLKND